MNRIFLSAPHMGTKERALLLDAFDSNWIAPSGEYVDAFEAELAKVVGVDHAVALSSGTAGLHLALLVLGVGPGDDVLLSDLTFAATANAVTYVGARPCFIDSNPATWTIDPDLIAHELAERERIGRPPKALITVDLYGQCADYDPIAGICSTYGIPIIEDAAEALGSTYRQWHAGSLGIVGVFSFNGNKIITTSGGGMLVSQERELVERARYLATQARAPTLHYEHTSIGHNYRLSNLLAAVGLGQLRSLDERVTRRREINEFYRAELANLPGIEFMPEASYGRSNCWLTCLTVDPAVVGASRDDIITALAKRDAEARPTWKPMHLQPVFEGLPITGGAVSRRIFELGLCLPSGSGLNENDLQLVTETIQSVAARTLRG